MMLTIPIVISPQATQNTNTGNSMEPPNDHVDFNNGTSPHLEEETDEVDSHLEDSEMNCLEFMAATQDQTANEEIIVTTQNNNEMILKVKTA
ncbi:hypothetical protein TSUD_216750 [Trifolium subterraneum]|uniref:Uncharacterized protein n=1 Tax=Trifolium subterraneum TaxID=3900 RepID=A0A2Z6LZZ1_TRISU|nr:hypothetical protein TSUD_216750 [Trifolium subterraneum]